MLVAKLARAASEFGRSLLALSGGVSANARLRERVAQMCRESGLRLRTAPPELCTDNALMIAFAASHRRAPPISSDLDIHPNFDPSDLTFAER